MPRVRQKTKRGSRPQRARTQKHPGRPSKYSAAVVARICKDVAGGCSREAAASLAGISASTFYAWQRDFPQFSEDLKRSDARCEQSSVAAIRRAGRNPRNWTANGWLLERKFPQRWGRVDRHLIHTTSREAVPLEADYIEAIRRALGFGKLQPLIGPGVARLLPPGEDCDLDIEVLPN